MCLGIPGKVIEIWEEAGTKMGFVDFGGTTKTVTVKLGSDESSRSS